MSRALFSVRLLWPAGLARHTPPSTSLTALPCMCRCFSVRWRGASLFPLSDLVGSLTVPYFRNRRCALVARGWMCECGLELKVCCVAVCGCSLQRTTTAALATERLAHTRAPWHVRARDALRTGRAAVAADVNDGVHSRRHTAAHCSGNGQRQQQRAQRHDHWDSDSGERCHAASGDGCCDCCQCHGRRCHCCRCRCRCRWRGRPSSLRSQSREGLVHRGDGGQHPARAASAPTQDAAAAATAGRPLPNLPGHSAACCHDGCLSCPGSKKARTNACSSELIDDKLHSRREHAGRISRHAQAER